MFTKDRKTKEKLLKSGLKLIGGKTKTRDIFYALRPMDATTYIEPFLGSGNVWTGLPRYEREYVNDWNGRVVQFFRIMQELPDQLWEAIDREVKVLRQRGEQYYYWMRENEPLSLIDNAAWFYIITKFSMNGIFRTNKAGKVNSAYGRTLEGRGIYTREWFDAVCDRIRGISIWNLDYRQFLATFDSYEAWAFIDPPYRACKTTYNGTQFTDADHIELRDVLASLKSRWLLTINDDEFTREIYKDFNVQHHEISYSCSQTVAGRGMRPELIVTNYELPVQSSQHSDSASLPQTHADPSGEV